MKKVKNLKNNRVIFLVAGIIFIFFGLFAVPFLFVGAFLLFLFYRTNKAYKEALKKETPKTIVPAVDKLVPESNDTTVNVTDLDGSVITSSIYQVIDSEYGVLISEGGKAYHTHLSCFKNWTGDAQRRFIGWKIIKKSDAINRGLTYCRFCKEDDNVTLDDLLDELDELE